MKKHWSLLAFLVLLSSLIAQEQHEVLVRNIEVPLRVFSDGAFVDDLTLDDIELYEDGKLQRIQALYLTEDAQVKRQQTDRDYMPVLERKFYFVFQLLEYEPKITDALDYFFTSVYLPGDYVSIMTLYKTYSLDPEALKLYSKEEVVDYIHGVIRKDTEQVTKEYNQLLRVLRKSATRLSPSRNPWDSEIIDEVTSPEESLRIYRDTLQKLGDLRILEENKFLEYAYQLKKQDGQKYVFFFYQKEYKPELRVTSNDSVLSAAILEITTFYNEKAELNAKRVSQAFADSSTLFNFIFMSNKPKRLAGVQMRDFSGNVKDVFTEVCQATGGIADDSPNLMTAVQNVSNATRSCYLLYYSPADYVGDGKFRKIEIKVKNKDYKTLFRQGYYAN